jgi:FtsP/CotA-like multicopper oxidase with cupredoxin domain
MGIEKFKLPKLTRREFLSTSGKALAVVGLGGFGSSWSAPKKLPKAPPLDLKKNVPVMDPGGIPHYFGPYPNYANSPLPELDAAGHVIPGSGIRKFVDSLPGLTAAGANNLGQYIPVAVPNKTAYPGSDYYEIELREYSEKMHSDLPPTKLRGYVQVVGGVPVTPIHYLGPLIIAQRNRPVRIKFTNKLPTGAGGDLFIPTDPTVMGAGMTPNLTEEYKQNRATIHLHGNNTVWISDGTPHQWITPASETTSYPQGVSVRNVPDMPDPGPGSQTFYYTNQQSARMMFYHDHAYGITRLNVYVGEAAGYLISDSTEKALVSTGVIPSTQIPLIIQDKTFVPGPVQLAAQDPTWDIVKWGGLGGLWFPHVYMPNQNPWDLAGMNAFGRWHYGPWFWPPTTINFPPIPNPYYDPVNAPWEPPQMPATPNPSTPAEAFMDTPIVNGTAYPYMVVEPRAYRFRILNACNDRFLNLQMYVADPTVTTADGRTNTEVKMVPAVLTAGFPVGWPIDGRVGGVPDPATTGPTFIQIGTEGGFLPAAVVLPNQPVDWNMNPTNFDMGDVNKGTLILGTAERADVIVDFSRYAGKTIILYNDAPAPFPALDARYDYFTQNEDLTPIGGAPSTQPGYGPNTRTIMQIRVANTTPARAYNLNALKAALPAAFRTSQDTIIVPEARYNAAYRGNFPTDPFVQIYQSSLTFTPIGQTTPLTIPIPFQMKALHDEMGASYDTDYGRMSAMLGLQRPIAGGAQNFMMYPYISPPVEIVKNSIYGTPIGSLGDGTQIWRITHNGVDTHTIHFHLFSVQLINRVAWDNAIRVPDANELGWKETLRVNPLQDTIVALRPSAPTNLPFTVPNSVRLLDVTKPDGATLPGGPGGFFNPAGNPISVINHLVNFGWEYVYHCHLLAHEEMDMMHAVCFAVSPQAPSNPLATVNGVNVVFTWKDNSTNETHWTIQRATAIGGPWTDIATVPSTTGGAIGGTVTYTDTPGTPGTYYYRAIAKNIVGDTTTPGFPTMSADSAPSGTSEVTL